jgi:hypothetical protein
MAASVFTRPIGLGCALGIVVWLAVRSPRLAIATAVAALLAYSPWPIRNYARLHAFVPLLTSGGVAGWNIQSNHEPIVAWTWMSQHQDLGEIGLDRYFRVQTRAIIQADPAAYVLRMTRAFVEYVGPILDRRLQSWMHRFALLAALPVLFWRDWLRRLSLPALVWLGQALLLVPIAVHERYRFPTEWLVIVAAATGFTAAAAHWGGRRTVLLAGGGLLLCVAFTVAMSRR